MVLMILLLMLIMNEEQKERKCTLVQADMLISIKSMVKIFISMLQLKKRGMPEVGLIRALEPIAGINLMAKRKGFSNLTGKK